MRTVQWAKINLSRPQRKQRTGCSQKFVINHSPRSRPRFYHSVFLSGIGFFASACTTPKVLVLAAQANAANILQEKIEEGVSIFQVDGDGHTPLIACLKRDYGPEEKNLCFPVIIKAIADLPESARKQMVAQKNEAGEYALLITVKKVLVREFFALVSLRAPTDYQQLLEVLIDHPLWIRWIASNRETSSFTVDEQETVRDMQQIDRVLRDRIGEEMQAKLLEKMEQWHQEKKNR